MDVVATTEEGRGYEIFYDDGSSSRLRPLPTSMSEFLLGSGFDRLLEQLSQFGINGIKRCSARTLIYLLAYISCSVSIKLSVHSSLEPWPPQGRSFNSTAIYKPEVQIREEAQPETLDYRLFFADRSGQKIGRSPIY
ncbi:hypothetical protein EV1_033766 [Malus domestica]